MTRIDPSKLLEMLLRRIEGMDWHPERWQAKYEPWQIAAAVMEFNRAIGHPPFHEWYAELLAAGHIEKVMPTTDIPEMVEYGAFCIRLKPNTAGWCQARLLKRGFVLDASAHQPKAPGLTINRFRSGMVTVEVEHQLCNAWVECLVDMPPSQA